MQQMQIGVSKEEIEVHIRSGKHQFNVDLQKLCTHSVGTKIDENPPAKSERVPKMDANIHGGEINNQNTELLNGINANDMHDRQNELSQLIGNGYSQLQHMRENTMKNNVSLLFVAEYTLNEFNFDDSDSYSSTVAVEEIATINSDSAANVTEVGWRSKQVSPNTPKIKVSTTKDACSSENLLQMSSQLSAFLESNLPTVEPVKAGVKNNVPRITGITLIRYYCKK